MSRYMRVAAALCVCLAARVGYSEQASAQQSPVTAIDIALEPDATMMRHAQDINARLLKVFPKGFRLDATHRPHITLLQRYVRTADLDKVYAAVDKVTASEKIASFRLRAFKYYYLPLNDLGVAGIVVAPTDDLLRLQEELIQAVEPFTTESGSAAAFVTTPEEPDINRPTMDYVATFVPQATGKHFNPHVTVGIAPQDYLRRMLSERFESFTFSPVATSVYQLGNFGTARKELKTRSALAP